MTTPSPVSQSFMVAMLGARMHYAVPRLLHRDARLTRLFTDLCASKGWLRLLQHWPGKFRPGGLQRLLNRVPHGVPNELIRTFTRLGFEYARRYAQKPSAVDRVKLYLDINQRFCRWVVNQDWATSQAVFVYNSAALEILREARRRGLRTVVEQTIAPFAYERQLLAEEHRRYPAWEADPGTAPEFDEFAEREREEWTQADLIVCGSDFVRDGVAHCGGPTSRCVVVPYGVDRGFDVAERPAHSGPLRILTVGTVGLRKGTPYAVEAARLLRQRAEFRWIGGISLPNEIRASLGSDVEFTGMIPRSEVIQHLSWADVFLLPSICEGSAVSTYEALTAGLPVVCTPNCGSVVRDAIDGFIVPIRDPKAIAARIDDLAANPSRCREMGEQARIRASQFDYDAYAMNLLSALKVIETD